jgi:hypothetical protein
MFERSNDALVENYHEVYKDLVLFAPDDSSEVIRPMTDSPSDSALGYDRVIGFA